MTRGARETRDDSRLRWAKIETRSVHGEKLKGVAAVAGYVALQGWSGRVGLASWGQSETGKSGKR